jgi:hypothetical protein
LAERVGEGVGLVELMLGDVAVLGEETEPLSNPALEVSLATGTGTLALQPTTSHALSKMTSHLLPPFTMRATSVSHG